MRFPEAVMFCVCPCSQNAENPASSSAQSLTEMSVAFSNRIMPSRSSRGVSLPRSVGVQIQNAGAKSEPEKTIPLMSMPDTAPPLPAPQPCQLPLP